MSKSEDLRLSAVLYRLAGHTYSETAEIFHASVSAIRVGSKISGNRRPFQQAVTPGIQENRPRQIADLCERTSGRYATGNRGCVQLYESGRQQSVKTTENHA